MSRIRRLTVSPVSKLYANDSFDEIDGVSQSKKGKQRGSSNDKPTPDSFFRRLDILSFLIFWLIVWLLFKCLTFAITNLAVAMIRNSLCSNQQTESLSTFPSWLVSPPEDDEDIDFDDITPAPSKDSATKTSEPSNIESQAPPVSKSSTGDEATPETEGSEEPKTESSEKPNTESSDEGGTIDESVATELPASSESTNPENKGRIKTPEKSSIAALGAVLTTTTATIPTTSADQLTSADLDGRDIATTATDLTKKKTKKLGYLRDLFEPDPVTTIQKQITLEDLEKD